jgi:hypothetical protein
MHRFDLCLLWHCHGAVIMVVVVVLPLLLLLLQLLVLRLTWQCSMALISMWCLPLRPSPLSTPTPGGVRGGGGGPGGGGTSNRL